MFLYMIENKTTGRFYLGQTRVSVADRVRQHRSKKSPMFSWFLHEQVVVKILATCVSLRELDSLEALYIDTYKEVFPSLIINKRHGGKRGSFPVESRNKMSLAHKGNNGCIGRAVRVSSRIKASRSLGCSAIVCSNGNTYETLREAADSLGIWRQNITHVLKGRLKTTGGLSFKFKES